MNSVNNTSKILDLSVFIGENLRPNSDCYTAYPSTGILPTSLIILAVKGTVVPFIYYGIKEIVRTDKIAMARSQKTGK